jgi:hypothetical protein
MAVPLGCSRLGSACIRQRHVHISRLELLLRTTSLEPLSNMGPMLIFLLMRSYNLYFYSAIVADIVASAVADSTHGPGRNLMFAWVYLLLGVALCLIGCCLGRLLGAADSYSWVFGQSMLTKVARRVELSMSVVCGCCGNDHHGGCGIEVGRGDPMLILAWRLLWVAVVLDP